MSTKRKGHNWKAREKVADVKIVNEARDNIKVNKTSYERFDESNPFVLPSKKRKTIVKKQHASTVKLLSKKQRKFYEKVLEKKKKKEGRAALMEQLHLVQGPANMLEKLTSITEIQTKGRKRMHQAHREYAGDVDEFSSSTGCGFVKVRRKFRPKNVRGVPVNDSNIIGFDQSDSESDSQSDENPEIDNNDMNSAPTEKTVDNRVPDSLCCEEAGDKSGDHISTNISDTSEKICEAKTCSSPEQSTSQNEAANNFQKTFTPVKSCKFFITVDRDPSIQRARLKLPIIGEEQVIMEAIDENDVVIIAGETGSGKTTQIPQFLYEAGYASNNKMIGITEPRRVAAISMSQRVAQELNLTSKEVSYLIRFEGNATPETQIKFMTDGVLIKELQKDFLLTQYSAIILDEAHERSVFTDVLIGLLSRITLLRRKRNNPLKLIIMSATLRLSDFTENEKLFKTTPPVIKVDGRQFPVTIHFNKETKDDYMSEAYKKACKVHTQLPEGGILIFLTGQQEVNTLVRKLRKTFPAQKKMKRIERNERRKHLNGEENSSDDEREEKEDSEALAPADKGKIPIINVEDYAIRPIDEELELSESEDDIEDVDIQYQRETHSPMWVLPLYSLLSSAKQARIFETPPNGYRLCVVATNVAETSLTIPNVKYVVDCGRIKMRAYDKLTGVSTFAVAWTSKASADQRAGRAGRTSAGHCYRLYSSAIYNDEFQDWNVPEIMRKPADDLVLMMKALRIDRVINFPFPSAPDLVQLRTAERRLTLLGALKPNKDLKDEWASTLTPLGKSMAVYPVAPRFAKMLCLNRDLDILSYTIVVVAALSVQEVLLVANDDYHKIWRSWAGSGNSLLLGDVMVLLRALGAAEYANSTKGDLDKFCEIYGLRYKAIVEARKLRVQLTNQVNLQVSNLNLSVDPKMLPPSNDQARKLRQVIMAGMVDHVARKLSNEELKQAGLSLNKAAYRTADMEEIVFLHPSSVLRKLKPEWVVFQEVFETQNNKLYARGITAIEPEWLPEYAAPLCNISDPLKYPAPYYDAPSGRVMCFVSSTFGRSGWSLPVTQLEYPLCEDKFKWFAVFFLDGCVVPDLKEYTQHLLSPPDLVFKPWAKFLTHRSNNFLRTLMERKVDSRRTLKMQWLADPKYLLESYLEWLPESAHKEVQDLWPPTCQ